MCNCYNIKIRRSIVLSTMNVLFDLYTTCNYLNKNEYFYNTIFLIRILFIKLKNITFFDFVIFIET